jgi:hypothetical protein
MTAMVQRMAFGNVPITAFFVAISDVDLPRPRRHFLRRLVEILPRFGDKR